MKRRNFVFLGPPGAGKGTQAKMVAEKYKIPQVSTGDMLRAAIASQSSLGREVQSFVTSGGLVPDNLVLSILLERIASDECKSGFILDGFPRTLGQAVSLDKALSDCMNPLLGVISINVPENELLERLTGRRSCESCGTSFHLKFSPPKQEGRCDQCKGNLYQRKDDTFEVISNRLKVYHDQTAPLIDFYSKQNNLYPVKGNGEIEVIFQIICDIIKDLS